MPYIEKTDTVLIFPGSGLGRLSYEFAKFEFGKVISIEYSGLMNAFSRFNYSKSKKSYTLHPYIHTCSDFYNTQSLLRTFEYKPISEKPQNLEIIEKDFTLFELQDKEKYKNVVVVSVFFLDTAENLMDYLDTIERITTPVNKNQKGYWINVGPLKYGSAAQVELNADELKDIRSKMGWNDIDSDYTIYNPKTLGTNNGLVGYVTDKESMWQGYYGLNMFTSKRKENK
ncbi:unnamed protein product [Candida verbasci]|uniref:Uncharacterized protein n=1 Tax=Candida verbasci TaxID=1227364 RepID=A0A9W4TTV3_9ASCO|nr:unnamed protein product [Candida verbasci]